MGVVRLKKEEEIILFLADKLEAHALPISFYEMVMIRLVNMSYKLSKKDRFALCISVLKMKENALNYCNITAIPKELYQKVAEMVCGDFLWTKFSSGTLDMDSIDFSGAITSLTEGDVKVSFGETSSDSDKFSALLQSMMSMEGGGLSSYRKLKW